MRVLKKLHLSVVGGCSFGHCYSILPNNSKEAYGLESGLKVSILFGKGDKNSGWTELGMGHPVLHYFG